MISRAGLTWTNHDGYRWFMSYPLWHRCSRAVHMRPREKRMAAQGAFLRFRRPLYRRRDTP